MSRDIDPVSDNAADFMRGQELLSRGMFSIVPDCVKIVAQDGRLLQMNPAGLKMIDAESFEDVAQMPVLDLVAPEHRVRWHDHHARVCGGEKLMWEFDLISLSGVRRRVQTHAARISLAKGDVGQLALTRQMTDEARPGENLQAPTAELDDKRDARARELSATEERLQTSERSFALLVDSVTDYALFMLDRVGMIISWNTGAERIKGYAALDIVGKHFSLFYSEEDRAAGIPMRSLGIAAQEGRCESEGWRIRKDGSRFWASCILDAIHAHGNVIGFTKITRDITERRATELRLREAQKLEAVGRFTGGAAHDFNNLLMAILGSLELLRKRLSADPRALALLDNAVLGAKRGASLTQRMLAFARRQELKQEAVDVIALIEEMRETMQQAVGADVRLTLTHTKKKLWARTDGQQLEAALLNLVMNARDAMLKEGLIEIHLSEQLIEGTHPTGLSPGRYACVSVKDDGHGMDELTASRAREPFFTTKGIGKGTGLGLSMVDGLMAQSGGKLTVSSQPNHGTTIELWLPESEEKETEVATAIGDSSATWRALERLCILAVDDDSLVLANVAAMLEDLGHTVIEAASGAKALEILSTRSDIDLLISDQAMPGMTGLELIAAARVRHPKLAAVLASGYSEVPVELGDGILRLAKPFTQPQLASAISARSQDTLTTPTRNDSDH